MILIHRVLGYETYSSYCSVYMYFYLVAFCVPFSNHKNTHCIELNKVVILGDWIKMQSKLGQSKYHNR